MTPIIPIKAFEKRRRHLKRYPSIYRPLTFRKVLKFQIRYPQQQENWLMASRLIPGKNGDYPIFEE